MNKLLFLAFISMFLSCDFDRGSTDYPKIDSVQDSILPYYTISTKDSLSLKQRKTAIDKSFVLAKTIGTGSSYSKVLYQKSLINFSLMQYDSLQIFNALLVNHASKIGDKDILGRQSYLMAYYYDKIIHQPDSAFSYYTLSKNYFEQIKDRSWVGRNLLNMGTIQKNHNDFFGSKETITEALQFLNPLKDRQYIANCYNNLAIDHRKLLNYNDAVTYHLKSIETSGSEVDKLTYHNNLAATYIDNEQYDEAISLLENLVKDSLLITNKIEYPRVLDNMAYVQWLSGKEEQKEAFLRPLLIRKQNNDKRGQIASYTHLGEYFLKINKGKAIRYLDTVIQISKQINNPKAELDVLKFLIKLEPKKVSTKDRHIFLQDSLYRQELKVKTQFAKYKYDDKLKQESILRLQKEKAEKELEITKERTQKTIYFFGFIFLLLGLGFVFHFFKQRTEHLKQQNEIEKLEATYETEAELSRRLHDDFGGQLNQAIVLVQNNAPKTKILDVLGGAYDQSRDFSREINEIDTGSKFTDELVAMLGLHAPENTKLYVTGRNSIDWSAINALSKITIHKVLLQLMMNMKEHSHANLVTIAFKNTPNTLKITYTDNGVGASSAELNTKNGLRNTENRIRAINGTIIFDSEKGKGFKAEIEIPN